MPSVIPTISSPVWLRDAPQSSANGQNHALRAMLSEYTASSLPRPATQRHRESSLPASVATQATAPIAHCSSRAIPGSAQPLPGRAANRSPHGSAALRAGTAHDQSSARCSSRILIHSEGAQRPQLPPTGLSAGGAGALLVATGVGAQGTRPGGRPDLVRGRRMA
jgi:hypothetical protein